MTRMKIKALNLNLGFDTNISCINIYIFFDLKVYEKNLIEACENGNGDLIRILLVSHNANPNIWTKVMAYISNYYNNDEIAIYNNI